MNIKIKNVRLSYPNLFTPKKNKDKPTEPGKYGCNLILLKTDPQVKAIRDAINAVAKEKWPKNMPKLSGVALKTPEAAPDGSWPTDGYDDTTMFLTTSSSKRVPIVDKDPTVALAAEDGKPYAGCYVNVSVRLWAQDNEFGKRVNCQLLAVQFAKDGQPFGEKPVDPNEEFEKVEDDESNLV
jgi:hypothetical protein